MCKSPFSHGNRIHRILNQRGATNSSRTKVYSREKKKNKKNVRTLFAVTPRIEFLINTELKTTIVPRERKLVFAKKYPRQF